MCQTIGALHVLLVSVVEVAIDVGDVHSKGGADVGGGAG